MTPTPTTPTDRPARRILTARPLLLGAVGLGLVGALAGCSTTGSSTSPAGAGDDAAGSDSGSDSGGSGSGDYADGDYSASGSYQTPDSATATITVDLTLKDNTVTAIEVTPGATGGNSKLYQDRFASGISDEVVGKRLDELSDVTRVAGSSLTHTGFQKAVEKIEQEAAAK